MASKKQSPKKPKTRISIGESQLDTGGGEVDPIYLGRYRGTTDVMSTPAVQGESGRSIRPAKLVTYIPPKVPVYPIKTVEIPKKKKPKLGRSGGAQSQGVD